MSTDTDLRNISTEARPLIEQWLDISEQMSALRQVATDKGLEWSQIKALLKAQIQDERDETGEGRRVRSIIERADNASAYADMLGLSQTEKNNFSSPQPYESAPAPAHETPAPEQASADQPSLETTPTTVFVTGGTSASDTYAVPDDGSIPAFLRREQVAS